MQRIDRRDRTAAELGLRGRGGLNDAFDDAIKEAYRINDAELDYISEHASDDELSVLIVNTAKKPSFGDKRQILTVLSKHLTKYHEEVHSSGRNGHALAD